MSKLRASELKPGMIVRARGCNPSTVASITPHSHQPSREEGYMVVTFTDDGDDRWVFKVGDRSDGRYWELLRDAPSRPQRVIEAAE